MREQALKVEQLSKCFRLPRVPEARDERREPLSRRWDRFWALRDITFSVPAGTTLGLIGPNGSGKSTLLKILADVMRPSSGSFEACGRVGALLELGAGFHPDLSGVENVYLNGALLGLDSHQVDRVLPGIIEFAELERFMDMPVRHFSSGMVTRLGFAMAAQLTARILLMDETFAAGDAAFTAKALAHIHELKRQGRTMVLVSHNMTMMLQLADQVMWLDHGRVRRIGQPRLVLAEYRRHVRGALESADKMRSVLGLQTAFEETSDPPGPIRIDAVRIEGESDRHEVEIACGDPVSLQIDLVRDPDTDRRVYLETAWARKDKILAHSRTRLELPAEPGPTRLSLDFNHLDLTEGFWRLALAVGPVESVRGTQPAYFDRHLNVGAVKVTTPNPFDIEVAANPLPHQWTHA